MPADVGTGTTVDFATSAWTAELISVGQQSIEREDINTSHLGTVDAHTFIPGRLVDQGELQMEFAFEPDTPPPVNAAAETITVSFPQEPGQTGPATVAFEGYISAWDWTAPLEDKMTGNATVKITGDATWTPAPTT